MRKLIIAALTVVALAFTVPQIVRSDGFNTVSDLTSVSSDICVANASGGCLQNEAVSTTNPTVVPDKSNDDTGIGGGGAGTISFIINGTEYGRVNDQGITAQVGGARLRSVTPTATVPNILPLGATDPNTGIGWAGADQLSLVAGGVASLHVRTTGVTIDTSTIDTLVVTTRSTITATGIVDLSSSDASTTTEGLVFPQHATACSGGTAEGQVCWEADANILHIGDSSGLQDFLPASAFSGAATLSGTGVVTTTAITAESIPGTTPTATGTDAVGIGDGAVAGDAAGDNGVLAIGANSTSTGVDSIAIGENTDATGDNSIAIGGNAVDATSADATAARAIAIGNNSLADAINGIAIGVTSNAGGTDAIAIGSASDASAIGAIAIGDNANAAGANCVAIGGNATNDDSADCSAADSVAIGQHILADDIGEFAFASGEFAAQSDAHTSIFVLRNQTTDGAQTELFSDGTAGDISVPSDCTVAFRISLAARRTDADNESAAYFFEGAIDNNAGTAALVGTIGKVIVAEDTVAWDATVTADMGGSVDVLVTGEAAKTIRWVARAEITEVCG